jgi:hypothetical protein
LLACDTTRLPVRAPTPPRQLEQSARKCVLCVYSSHLPVYVRAAADADWDEVINRVSYAAFGCSRYVRSYDVADPSGKAFNPVSEAKRQKEERMAQLQNPLDPRVRLLEDEVMEKLWCSRLGDSSPEERDAMDATLRLPGSQVRNSRPIRRQLTH